MADDRDETELESWDRRLNELLQELRVAQTGVQILFAFLLTLAFTQRFGSVSDTQRTAYVITLIAAAAAATATAAWFMLFWYVLPLWYRNRRNGQATR